MFTSSTGCIIAAEFGGGGAGFRKTLRERCLLMDGRTAVIGGRESGDARVKLTQVSTSRGAGHVLRLQRFCY